MPVHTSNMACMVRHDRASPFRSACCVVLWLVPSRTGTVCDCLSSRRPNVTALLPWRWRLCLCYAYAMLCCCDAYHPPINPWHPLAGAPLHPLHPSHPLHPCGVAPFTPLNRCILHFYALTQLHPYTLTPSHFKPSTLTP